MRRRFKLLLIFCLLFLLIPNVKAEDFTGEPYYIDSYDVDMVVNSDNSYDITEKISISCSPFYENIFS